MCIQRISLLLIVFFISIGTNAADFEYKGEKINSSIHLEEVICDGYKLKVETEKFPFKYEERIPANFIIEGYYGGAGVISKKAYFYSGKTVSIPRADEIEEIKKDLIEGRTYLPTDARCRGNSFVIQYWSGGNCKGREAFVEFSVSEDAFISPSLIPYSKVREEYKK